MMLHVQSTCLAGLCTKIKFIMIMHVEHGTCNEIDSMYCNTCIYVSNEGRWFMSKKHLYYQRIFTIYLLF